MPLEPSPMQVIHNAFTTKKDVFEDLKRLDLWPTTHVSERMEELPLHWYKRGQLRVRAWRATATC